MFIFYVSHTDDLKLNWTDLLHVTSHLVSIIMFCAGLLEAELLVSSLGCRTHELRLGLLEGWASVHCENVLACVHYIG